MHTQAHSYNAFALLIYRQYYLPVPIIPEMRDVYRMRHNQTPLILLSQSVLKTVYYLLCLFWFYSSSGISSRKREFYCNPEMR
jgi:hypothetical protein